MAIDFDGNDSLSFGDIGDAEGGTDTMVGNLWIRYSAANDTGMLCKWVFGTWGLFGHFGADADKPTTLFQASAGNRANWATTENDSEWHSIFYGSDGTNMIINVDGGTKVVGAAITGAILTTADILQTMKYSSAAANFTTGQISECALWSGSALSDNIMNALASGIPAFAFGTNPTLLIMHYQIDPLPVDYITQTISTINNGDPTNFAGNPPVDLIENYL